MTSTADEWIEWTGGECPVPSGTIVETELRDRRILPAFNADTLLWDHADAYNDIVRYRVVKP